MLGGLAKANTWVAKPGGSQILAYSSPWGAWLKANLKVIRPEDIIPNEYKSLLSLRACLVGKVARPEP
jgi:hypothetical protein